MNMESSIFVEKVQTRSEEAAESEIKERSVAEKETLMMSFCAERGNPVTIIEPGSEISKTPGLKKKFEEISDDAIREILREAVPSLNRFLHSPVFTDTFHEDHSLRRQWERENKDDLNEDVAQYYDSNRLGLNLLSQAPNIITILSDPDYSQNFSPEVQQQIKLLNEKVDKATPDNFKNYGTMNDAEKLNLLSKIEDINKDLLSLLAVEEGN